MYKNHPFSDYSCLSFLKCKSKHSSIDTLQPLSPTLKIKEQTSKPAAVAMHVATRKSSNITRNVRDVRFYTWRGRRGGTLIGENHIGAERKLCPFPFFLCHHDLQKYVYIYTRARTHIPHACVHMHTCTHLYMSECEEGRKEGGVSHGEERV